MLLCRTDVKSWFKMIFRKKLLLENDIDSIQLLNRSIQRINLFCFGVGSTIGAGIFILSGQAAQAAGPGVVVSFLLVAISCLLSGLCFAEFASAVPLTGSAYIFTYVTIGELPAFLIGWILITEYGCTLIVLAQFIAQYIVDEIQFWGGSYIFHPHFFGEVFSLNWFASLICLLLVIYMISGLRGVTYLNGIGFIISVSVLFLVILYGATKVDTRNWDPFFPTGIPGVISGANILFFSYIGFDGVVAFSEEVLNPEKDIPVVIIGALFFCSVLYFFVGLIMTGMFPMEIFSTDPPVLSDIFADQTWSRIVVTIGAVMALLTTMQSSMICISRALFAMSRDGLLPKIFSRLVNKEPLYAHLIAGTVLIVLSLPVVSVQVLFTHLSSLAILTSFTIVNTAVLILRENVPESTGSNNLKHFVMIYILASILLGLLGNYFQEFVIIGLVGMIIPSVLIFYYFYKHLPYPIVVFSSSHFQTPLVPLIPMIGISTNIFFMFTYGSSLFIFIGWIGFGILIYFLYSIRHSLERRQSVETEHEPLIKTTYD